MNRRERHFAAKEFERVDKARDYAEQRANPVERLRDLLLGGDTVGEDDVLTYTWNRGYETLDLDRGRSGMHYAATFHPGDGSCVGSGVCVYCGYCWGEP